MKKTQFLDTTSLIVASDGPGGRRPSLIILVAGQATNIYIWHLNIYQRLSVAQSPSPRLSHSFSLSLNKLLYIFDVVCFLFVEIIDFLISGIWVKSFHMCSVSIHHHLQRRLVQNRLKRESERLQGSPTASGVIEPGIVPAGLRGNCSQEHLLPT